MGLTTERPLYYRISMLRKILKFLKKKKKYLLLSGEYKSYNLALKNIVSDTNYLNLKMIKEIKFVEETNFKLFNRHIFSSQYCSKTDEINNILEFGAGAEPILKYIKSEKKNKMINYVVEKKEVIEQIQLPENLTKNIFYITKFDDLHSNKIDAVVFNSSLQYLNDFEYIFNKIVNSKIKYLIITDTIFSNFDEHLYTLQVNIKPSKFVYIILSFNKIYNFLKKNNYELIDHISKKNHLGEDKTFYKIHETIDNKNLDFKSLIFKLVK